MTRGILDMLSLAPYGAYAVNMHQAIVFWNRSAERILGHKTEQVIGQRCYEICQNLPQNGSTLICMEGCPSIRLARQGNTPPVVHVRILCASGSRKLVTVTPMIVPADTQDGQLLLVHLFHEKVDDARAVGIAENLLGVLSSGEESLVETADMIAHSTSEVSALTPREVQVLRLMAEPLSEREIARELKISTHTALNHIRNIRAKLKTQSRLDAVLTAQRLGLLELLTT